MRLDLHARRGECTGAGRASQGPTLDELAERFPSVKFGQEQWYRLLRADNGMFDAILRDMTKQALKHPIEEEYGPEPGRPGLHWHPPAP